MSQHSKVVLGLIQIHCEEDPRKNLDHAVQKIKQAAREGAQIVCLQELFCSKYFCQSNDDRFFSLAETIPGSSTEALSKVAKENKVVIVASFFERDEKNYFNTACVMDADGKFLGKYRKVHIPDDLPNHYSERYYFKPGDLGFPIFETRYAKIGVQVCWDQWYPEGARSLAMKGAEIIFYPTAIGWPVNPPLTLTLSREGRGEDIEEIDRAEYDAWVTVQRGHAISNGVFVAATNRTGREDQLQFWGGSFVADPLGRILKQASHDQEENLIVECHLNRIQEVRKDWPFLKCRRPDVY